MSIVVAPPLATTWFDPAVLSIVLVLAGWYRLGNRRPGLREVGTAFVFPTTVRGETVARLALVNPRTTVEDLRVVLDTMRG